MLSSTDKAEYVFRRTWQCWRNCRKEVVLIGVQDHLEIWDLNAWQTYISEKQAHFDEIAESALEGSTSGFPA